MKNFIRVTVLLGIFIAISLGFTKNKSTFILGDPIPGVDVALEQIPSGIRGVTQTDVNGNYSFKNLSAGVYKISFGTKKSIANKEQSRMRNKVAIKDEGVKNKNNKQSNVGTDIIVTVEDHNSSRSNVSYIFYRSQEVPQVHTKILKSKIDLKKTNIQTTIKLSKPVKVLKGVLTY
ncbi:carboxypeptidase regulatory-like domain-containing protein, partial [Olleya sp. AH-315-F22]|nr:carboxypeptidase regulatory-like domain-containing protein [Olleya sp. AH-315-F22]